MDLQHGLPVLILHNELGGERVPLLDHIAHGVARRGLHLQLRAQRRKYITEEEGQLKKAALKIFATLCTLPHFHIINKYYLTTDNHPTIGVNVHTYQTKQNKWSH